MHVAVIPARMGSQGFRFKNRLFFDATADFLQQESWFQRVIVSTDDPEIVRMAQGRGFEVHARPPELAGPAVPIKPVFASLIPAMRVENDDRLWLFYLPVLHKNPADFHHARQIIAEQAPESLCTFVPAKTHPMDCWAYDPVAKRLSQYIPNEIFRRQDKPLAWAHYHYVCCFRAGHLDELSNELLNARTHPIFFDQTQAQDLIEVDTPEDYVAWQQHLARKVS